MAIQRPQNTIDLIVVSKLRNIIIGVQQGCLFSDHIMLLFNINTSKMIARSKTVTFIIFKNINTAELALDIPRDLAKCNLKSMSLDECIDKYNSVLKNTLDKHTQEKTKTVKTRSPTPWFSDDIRSEIQI